MAGQGKGFCREKLFIIIIDLVTATLWTNFLIDQNNNANNGLNVEIVITLAHYSDALEYQQLFIRIGLHNQPLLVLVETVRRLSRNVGRYVLYITNTIIVLQFTETLAQSVCG